MLWAVIFFFGEPVAAIAVQGDDAACQGMLEIMIEDTDVAYDQKLAELVSIPGAPTRDDITFECLEHAPDLPSLEVADDTAPEIPLQLQSDEGLIVIQELK